jgi:hypothetical protein
MLSYAYTLESEIRIKAISEFWRVDSLQEMNSGHSAHCDHFLGVTVFD